MKKLLSSTIAVGIFATLNFSPVLAIDANTLPSGWHDLQNAQVTQQGSDKLNVQVQGGHGSVGTVHWNNFNVGKDANVNFEFTGNNQTSLNIVDKSGGLSNIYGSLTNSCGVGCGYAGTGKVILINPNGVLFGETANVNLNSFTVSTFDANYDKDNGKLTLTRQNDSGDITVKGGAQIHGDKNVAMAASNIYTYANSKISTNIDPNFYDTAYGKVKLVTSDGVNFTYYNNGAIKQVGDVKASTDQMKIILNGEINSGHIDVRNQSVNTGSDINIAAGAKLKATKAEKGNDGNIWLTSANTVTIGDSNLETVNGGEIRILAQQDADIGKSTLKSSGDVFITSDKKDVVVESSTIEAAKDITIKANNIASAQKNSKLTANNITIEGNERAQVLGNSSLEAKEGDINIKGKKLRFTDATLTAKNNINAEATETDLIARGNTNLNANNITLKAKTDVKTADGGVINVNEKQTNIYAQTGDIDVKLAGVGNKQKGLIAESEKNVTIETDGDLSVGRLIAKNGNMTLSANNIVAGLPHITDEYFKTPGDSADRSYIYVLNGEFKSTTKGKNFTVTDSTDPVDKSEGNFNKKHMIQYDDNEKILLVNKRPYTPSTQPDNPQNPSNVSSTVNYDDRQASMLNKMPRQPEIFNNNTQITNSRTSLVDVFAAASQIEIEDDEEE